MPSPDTHHNTVIHLDMNSFFASVEQTANPFLRGKPVGVGDPSYVNTALVAVSYEGKRKGVKTFMRGIEAREKCPDLIVVPGDFLKYYAVNRQIMDILREYSPLVEVYSIDEAFIDLTPVLHLYNKPPREIAQEIKDRIRAEIGSQLTSSVGIGPNKLLAKIGSDWKKPDGLTEISWENRFEFLDNITPLTEVWGIGFRGGGKLANLGITSLKQIREMPDQTLRGIVGSYYTRLKMIANGEHYDPVNPNASKKPHKSMQHAHTMSKPTNDIDYLHTVIRKMSERLARRIRKHEQKTGMVYLGLRPEKQREYGWGYLPNLSGIEKLSLPTQSGKEIYLAACRIMENFDLSDTRIRLLAVGIHDLSSTEALVFDIFENAQVKKVDQAVDSINQMYGEFTIRSADIVYQYAKERELHVEKEDMVFHPE